MATEDSDEILHDLSPLYIQYKDGRIKRLIASPKIPASQDPVTGVRSKDVVIQPEKVSARIYLPSSVPPSQKLPLLVFYHGGAFVIESAFGALYHAHVNATVAEANVVAVSVEYRLAPENPLPAAYEDSWEALKWISYGSNGDDWISQFADLDRVYIAGDSAGGNIAHYVSLRAGIEPLDSINLIGCILNCPFFGGEECLENEQDHPIQPKHAIDKTWKHVWNDTTGLHDPRIDPLRDENLHKFKPQKVLLFTAEHCFFKQRALVYKEGLIKSGWNGEIELIEGEDEHHVYSVAFPDKENSKLYLKKVAAFINQ